MPRNDSTQESMMRTTERTITVAAKTITCCHRGCGLSFSVPAWWEAERRRLHDSWYCPNGHAQHFAGETAEERRIRELEADKERLQRWHADARKDATIEREARKSVERRLSATKGVLTRTRKRVAHGVCPCCSRTFAQLARHMATKHPDYVETSNALTPTGADHA